MKITATLKSMVERQTLIFTLYQYESLVSTISRLHRKGEGKFFTRRRENGVSVTCVQPWRASPKTPKTRDRSYWLSVKESLEWKAEQYDPEQENADLYLVTSRTNTSSRIRIPVKGDMRAICALLIEFVDLKLK